MAIAEPAVGLRFGRTVVESVVGEIVDQEVEAVALAATGRGVLTTGVASALRARGAGQIERSGMSAGPRELGTAFLTPAPGLEARGVRMIAHAAVYPALGGAARIDDVRRAVAAVLATVETGRWRSLALPLLGLDGAGVVRPPAERVVDAIVDELVGCLRRASARPDRLVVVARSADHAAMVDAALGDARRRVWALGR